MALSVSERRALSSAPFDSIRAAAKRSNVNVNLPVGGRAAERGV